MLQQEKNVEGNSNGDSSVVTPATISRTLYERVLSRQAARGQLDSEATPLKRTDYVNGPGRAQFDGLEDLPEVKSLRKLQKPQYVTIERSKSVRFGFNFAMEISLIQLFKVFDNGPRIRGRRWGKSDRSSRTTRRRYRRRKLSERTPR